MKMNWYDTKCSIFGLRFSDMEINIKRQSNYRFIFETIFIWASSSFPNYFICACCLCSCICTGATKRGEQQKREKKSKQFQFELRHIRLCFICGAHIRSVRVPVFHFCALHSLIKRYVCMWVSLALQLNSNMSIPETCVNVVVLRLIQQSRNVYATNEKQHTRQREEETHQKSAEEAVIWACNQTNTRTHTCVRCVNRA